MKILMLLCFMWTSNISLLTTNNLESEPICVGNVCAEITAVSQEKCPDGNGTVTSVTVEVSVGGTVVGSGTLNFGGCSGSGSNSDYQGSTGDPNAVDELDSNIELQDIIYDDAV